MKLDPVIKRELKLVSLWVLGLSLLMELAFALLGKWSWGVPMGNLLGAGAAIGNFFLMCRTIQKAVGLEENQIKTRVKASQQLRLLMQGAVAAAGFLVPFIDPWATVIPLLFPSICMYTRPMWDRSLRDKDRVKDTSPEEGEPG